MALLPAAHCTVPASATSSASSSSASSRMLQWACPQGDNNGYASRAVSPDRLFHWNMASTIPFLSNLLGIISLITINSYHWLLLSSVITINCWHYQLLLSIPIFFWGLIFSNTTRVHTHQSSSIQVHPIIHPQPTKHDQARPICTWLDLKVLAMELKTCCASPAAHPRPGSHNW